MQTATEQRKRITNTQYLKRGVLTNVGTVKQIHDAKGFTTTDGWYWDIDRVEVYKYESPKNRIK